MAMEHFRLGIRRLKFYGKGWYMIKRFGLNPQVVFGLNACYMTALDGRRKNADKEHLGVQPAIELTQCPFGCHFHVNPEMRLIPPHEMVDRSLHVRRPQSARLGYHYLKRESCGAASAQRYKMSTLPPVAVPGRHPEVVFGIRMLSMSPGNNLRKTYA